MLGVKLGVTTRRQFLKRSFLAAGVLPFIRAGNLSFAGVKSPIDPKSMARFTKSFSGSLFVPRDKGYETARIPSMNPEMQKFPAIIAQCTNEDDVLRCLDLAHQQTLEVAVRSGNHSYLGWGTCNNGIVVDLSKMKNVRVDPVQRTAQVSAGNTAEEILAAAAAQGLAPVLGECGTVGAGLVLGGGLGWLSGKFGATSDNLLSARLITADGRILPADSQTNPDLFWAIRGGGGNFGIATSFQYQLHSVKEVLAGSLIYPATKARATLRIFREFMATAPDDLQAECWLTNLRDGWFSIQLVYAGDLEEGERVLKALRSASAPVQNLVKRRPFSQTYNMDGDVEFASCPFLSEKGTYIEQFSDDVIDLILTRVAQPPPSCALLFNFSHYMHGQVCRVPPNATAFGLRKSDAIHLVSLVQWKNRADTPACLSWHKNTFELLQKYSDGHTYANYMSVAGETSPSRTYGDNLDRLRELKKKYDPQNFFHLNANILPA